MKFYIDTYNFNYQRKIKFYKLNAILINYNKYLLFYKNGNIHNIKNAALTATLYKCFYLNGIYHGDQIKFTKHLWRKFVKMQVFK
jgi:hypothetical protein